VLSNKQDLNILRFCRNVLLYFTSCIISKSVLIVNNNKHIFPNRDSRMKRKNDISKFFLKKQKSGADQGQTDPSPSVSCCSEPCVGGQGSQEEKDDVTQEPSVSPAGQSSEQRQ